MYLTSDIDSLMVTKFIPILSFQPCFCLHTSFVLHAELPATAATRDRPPQDHLSFGKLLSAAAVCCHLQRIEGVEGVTGSNTHRTLVV